MTEDDLALLKSSIDGIIVLVTVRGEHILARPLVVFDEGDTPDVFFLEMEPAPNGTYIQKGNNGYSLLLAELLSVHALGQTA